MYFHFAPLLRQDFSEFSSQPPVNCEAFHFALWEQVTFLTLPHKVRVLLLGIFSEGLSLLSVVPSFAGTLITLLSTLKKPLLVSGSAFVWSSLFLLSFWKPSSVLSELLLSAAVYTGNWSSHGAYSLCFQPLGSLLYCYLITGVLHCLLSSVHFLGFVTKNKFSPCYLL